MTQHLLPHTSDWGILGYNEAIVQQVALLPDYAQGLEVSLGLKQGNNQRNAARQEGWMVSLLCDTNFAAQRRGLRWRCNVSFVDTCLPPPYQVRACSSKRRPEAAWNALTLSSPSSWNIPGEMILSFKGPRIHAKDSLPPRVLSPPADSSSNHSSPAPCRLRSDALDAQSAPAGVISGCARWFFQRTRMISIGCFNFNLPAVGIRHGGARAQRDEVPVWMARRKKTGAV